MFSSFFISLSLCANGNNYAKLWTSFLCLFDMTSHFFGLTPENVLSIFILNCENDASDITIVESSPVSFCTKKSDVCPSTWWSSACRIDTWLIGDTRDWKLFTNDHNCCCATVVAVGRWVRSPHQDEEQSIMWTSEHADKGRNETTSTYHHIIINNIISPAMQREGRTWLLTADGHQNVTKAPDQGIACLSSTWKTSGGYEY